MDEHIYKRHNKSLLLYHLVFPMKYRREVLTKEIGESFQFICVGISERYEVQFAEIGYESDHVHFLVQSVPDMSVSKLVTIIKSLSERELFKKHPEIKRILWGGNLWTSGYYVNTVGQYGNKDVIRKDIENQGKETEYKKIHGEQLKLWD
ncbi:IS200/IS605 family transposase [Chryseobacterium sp. PS-8]|uniref:IS200/IS605 family transposase n=1 Tax=Chryseobacterium indicum TaxID=2766954 RepID=A0ABS9C8R6_9FLAO|nr:IS200/IS605 family transposase [Chryseobacterium sp. PS-8]MCF2220680.1 IS200/IS605 family transposase [Chryseobacterium sp. PS-8]